MTDNGQYERTHHLALPLYTDTTPVNLRDGYNEAMRLIDRKMHQLEIMVREAKEGNQ